MFYINVKTARITACNYECCATILHLILQLREQPEEDILMTRLPCIGISVTESYSLDVDEALKNTSATSRGSLPN